MVAHVRNAAQLRTRADLRQGQSPKLIIVAKRQLRARRYTPGVKPQLSGAVYVSQSASSVPLDRTRGVGYPQSMATVMRVTDRVTGRVLSERSLTVVPVRSSRRARTAAQHFTRDPQGTQYTGVPAFHRSPVDVSEAERLRQIAADLEANRRNRIHKKAR